MNSVVKGEEILHLKQAMESAIASGELTKVEFPLEHFFTESLYARRIHVPADATVVTAVHKVQHITVALKGHCIVVDELGMRHEVKAPSVFVTEPGTQRAVYAITDTEWLTVHPYSGERDITIVEKALVDESMQIYLEKSI